MRKFLTVALVLTMLLAMAVPAFAAAEVKPSYDDQGEKPYKYYPDDDLFVPGEDYFSDAAVFDSEGDGTVDIPVWYNVGSLSGNQDDFDNGGKDSADANPNYRVVVVWDGYAGKYTPAVKYIWNTDELMYTAVEDTQGSTVNIPATEYVKVINYSNGALYCGFAYESVQENKVDISVPSYGTFMSRTTTSPSMETFNSTLSLQAMKDNGKYMGFAGDLPTELGVKYTGKGVSETGCFQFKLNKAYGEGEVQIGTLKVVIEPKK